MLTISKTESERYTLEDFGNHIVLRSKLVPSIAISFRHWDDVDEVRRLLDRALPPEFKEGKDDEIVRFNIEDQLTRDPDLIDYGPDDSIVFRIRISENQEESVIEWERLGTA